MQKRLQFNQTGELIGRFFFTPKQLIPLISRATIM